MGHPGMVKLSDQPRGLHGELLTPRQDLAPSRFAIVNQSRLDVSKDHVVSPGFIGKDFVVPLKPHCPEIGSF
jgi:hypothetical protein